VVSVAWPSLRTSIIASLCPHGDAKLCQFGTKRKGRQEKSASIAGARPMPPIRGRSGGRRPLRRWQMKALLG
jgi:hypothetical protein